jgi:flagellar hook assembly protein FlgD
MTLGPNPFQTNTTITFSLTLKSRIDLSIYDLRGQQLRSLLFSTLSAGSYTIKWDAYDASGNKVPAGIYFLRVLAGSSIRTKNLILIR